MGSLGLESKANFEVVDKGSFEVVGRGSFGLGDRESYLGPYRECWAGRSIAGFEVGMESSVEG